MDIFSLIYPRKCLQCGKGGEYLCPGCLGEVNKSQNSYPSNLLSVWKYEGVVKKAILRLKYGFVRDIANELGVKYAKELKENPKLPKKAILVPIPLSSRRNRWRGFNQAAEVGKVVAKEMEWDFEPTLLSRQKHTIPQVGLPKIERLRNTSGIFAVNTEAKLEKDETIVIFDDVWTTGATLNEASGVLKKAGFREIWKIVIAR